MADLLDRTARQVRMPGQTVHKLTTTRTLANLGRRYQTRCGLQLAAARGAMLTTRPVGCHGCTTAATAEQREREMVEAILGEVPTDG